MQRILVVVHHLGRGGTERSAKNFAALYHELGYKSALLVFSKERTPNAYLDGAKLPIFCLEPSLKAKEREQLLSDIKAWKADIVHIHNHGVEKRKLLPWLPELHPAPFVMETCHFPLLSDYDEYVDLHLQLSYWCLWQYYGLHKKPKHKAAPSYIVPHVIDTEAFRPLENASKNKIRRELSLALPKDAFVFGRVGQAYRDKWSHLIFHAFAKVAAKHKNAYLLLVGLPAEHRQYCRSLPLALQARIIIEEITDDPLRLQGLYQSMDVFLHAADQGETFGKVLAEAMLCSVPVITLFTPYRDNAQLEVIGLGRNSGPMPGGCIAANARQMVRAMRKLMESKETYQQFASASRELVIQNYSPRSVGRQIQAIIEELRKNKTHKQGKEKALAKPKPEYSYERVKQEIQRQLQVVYGRAYRFHFMYLCLLQRTQEPLRGKLVWFYRLLLGHITWRSFCASLKKQSPKLRAKLRPHKKQL